MLKDSKNLEEWWNVEKCWNVVKKSKKFALIEKMLKCCKIRKRENASKYVCKVKKLWKSLKILKNYENAEKYGRTWLDLCKIWKKKNCSFKPLIWTILGLGQSPTGLVVFNPYSILLVLLLLSKWITISWFPIFFAVLTAIVVYFVFRFIPPPFLLFQVTLELCFHFISFFNFPCHSLQSQKQLCKSRLT